MNPCPRSLVVALLFTLGGALPASADTYYVRASGNDQADGRTPGSAFRTLLRAAQVRTCSESVRSTASRRGAGTRMVTWPSGAMFSDPTRSYPFELGGPRE